MRTEMSKNMKHRRVIIMVVFILTILMISCANSLMETIEKDIFAGIVADPVINPFGGIFVDNQSVQISCSTPDAIIRYTLDGSNPSEGHGIVYSGAFSVNAGTVTVKAIAYRDIWTPSQVVSAEFEITGKVGAPIFSKTPGAYTNSVDVELSSSTASAIIHYTLDGSDPSRVAGILYSGNPITVSSDTTIKAIAYVDSWDSSSDSAIISGFFDITGIVSNPGITPSSGYYTTGVTVTLSSTTTGATIRYTTNGANPSRSVGTVYSSPFIINSSGTVKAMAYIPAWEASSDSTISTTTYTITGYCAAPSFSVSSGYYDTARSVTLTCSTGGSVIKYTTNGTTPSRSNGSIYSPAIDISSTTTLRAVAYVPAWQTSSDSSGERTYMISGSYGQTRIIGGSGVDVGLRAVRDSNNNVYIVGYFYGTVNFGADFSTTDNKTAVGSPDAFITRINSDGSYGWTRRLGGPCVAYDIAIDSSNNIYITGTFSGTVNFKADFGGTDSKTYAGGSGDIFITKISQYGNYYWTKRFGGTNNDLEPRIAVDSNGNIFLEGEFFGTINNKADFGGTDNKTATGLTDVFVTKISSTLVYQWTKIFGGTGYERSRGITTNSIGDVILTGNFGGTVDFGTDFGISRTEISKGSYDIFLLKITPTNILTVRSIGGTGTDEAKQIKTVGSYLYLTGLFRDTVNFKADFAGTDSKSSAGEGDAFLTKFSSSLAYQWTRRFGSTDDDQGNDVNADSNGNIYLTGSFRNTTNFASDFGGTDNKISAGSTDAFVTKLASNGTYGWTRSIGNDAAGSGAAVISFSDRRLLLVSLFGGTLNFADDFGSTDNKSSNASTFDVALTWID